MTTRVFGTHADLTVATFLLALIEVHDAAKALNDSLISDFDESYWHRLAAALARFGDNS